MPKHSRAVSFSLQRRSKAKQINPNSGSSSKNRRSQFQRSSPSSSPTSPPLRLRSLSPAAPISVEVPDDSRVVTCTPCNGYMHLQCKYRRRFRRRSTSHSAAPHQLKNYLDCWFVMKLFIPKLEVSIARIIGDKSRFTVHAGERGQVAASCATSAASTPIIVTTSAHPSLQNHNCTSRSVSRESLWAYIVGQDSESSRLHVDIFQLCFHIHLRHVL